MKIKETLLESGEKVIEVSIEPGQDNEEGKTKKPSKDYMKFDGPLKATIGDILKGKKNGNH